MVLTGELREHKQDSWSVANTYGPVVRPRASPTGTPSYGVKPILEGAATGAAISPSTAASATTEVPTPSPPRPTRHTPSTAQRPTGPQCRPTRPSRSTGPSTLRLRPLPPHPHQAACRARATPHRSPTSRRTPYGPIPRSRTSGVAAGPPSGKDSNWVPHRTPSTSSNWASACPRMTTAPAAGTFAWRLLQKQWRRSPRRRSRRSTPSILIGQQ